MKYYKYKMNIGFLNVFAIILMIIALIVYYSLFSNDVSYYFIIYLILWLFLHEIIHGLSFIAFKEVRKKNVVFGAKLESGIFYCMCKQVISRKIILVALLAPLVLIGFITLVISIIWHLPVLALLSLFNISGAIGDIMMSIMFFRLPDDVCYTDLDDCESFVVISKDNLENRKFWGLDLIESGKYTNKIVAKDFQKIRCSKVSLIILIIIFVLFIISLI